MKWIWRTIGVIGMAVLASACHQNDTVFVVNTTDDTVDSNPGDGFCNDANGDCSLRAAVMEANALPGVEEIRLIDGAEHVVSLTGFPDTEAVGDIDITSGMVITGEGLVGAVDVEHRFHVDAPGQLVEFDGMDLAFGRAGIQLDAGTLSVAGLYAQTGSLNGDFLEMTGGTAFIMSSTFDDGAYAQLADVADGTLHIQNVASVSPSFGVSVRDGRAFISHSAIAGDLEGEGGPRIHARASILAGFCIGVSSDGHNIIEGTPQLNFGRCEMLPAATDVLVPGTIGRMFVRDYGGPVPTAVVLPDVVIDRATASACTAGSIDARGVERPVGRSCDIGPVEVERGDCAAGVAGGDVSFCDLAGEDLSGLDLSGLRAVGAVLTDTDLRGSILRGADLSAADLDDADMSGADATDAVIASTDGVFRADGTNFTRADISYAAVSGAAGADFTDAFGYRFSVGLLGIDMTGAHMEGADFSDAAFDGVISSGVTGTPLSMRQGSGIVNGVIFARYQDISGQNFSGADFTGVGLLSVSGQGADLSNATLTYSISESRLQDADLTGADLSGAYVWQAVLDRATVVGASVRDIWGGRAFWRGATIVGTDFTGADLERHDFTDAVMLWNTFGNTICPSGVNSDSNGGNCDGQFTRGAPQPPGAPVPQEFRGREAEFATLGGN